MLSLAVSPIFLLFMVQVPCVPCPACWGVYWQLCYVAVLVAEAALWPLQSTDIQYMPHTEHRHSLVICHFSIPLIFLLFAVLFHFLFLLPMRWPCCTNSFLWCISQSNLNKKILPTFFLHRHTINADKSPVLCLPFYRALRIHSHTSLLLSAVPLIQLSLGWCGRI